MHGALQSADASRPFTLQHPENRRIAHPDMGRPFAAKPPFAPETQPLEQCDRPRIAGTGIGEDTPCAGRFKPEVETFPGSRSPARLFLRLFLAHRVVEAIGPARLDELFAAPEAQLAIGDVARHRADRKSTRLNSSH